VLVNDVIRRVNDQPILTREALIRAIRGYNPGDEVELEIEREGETTTLRAVLQGHFPGLPDRSEFQNNLGTSLSVRRFGFPQALQHDAVLRAADCGGPVVNLDGEVVGINIARAGRTETYALPAAAVSSLLEDWLAPAAAEVDRGARQKTAVTSEAPAVAVP
jgi:serine protease Do